MLKYLHLTCPDTLAQVQAHLQTAEKPSLLLCLQKSLSFFLRTVYRIALCTKVLTPLSPIFSGRLALVSIQTAQLPTPAMYYCRIFFIFVKHFSHVTFLPYDTTRTTISATNTQQQNVGNNATSHPTILLLKDTITWESTHIQAHLQALRNSLRFGLQKSLHFPSPRVSNNVYYKMAKFFIHTQKHNAI